VNAEHASSVEFEINLTQSDDSVTYTPRGHRACELPKHLEEEIVVGADQLGLLYASILSAVYPDAAQDAVEVPEI
jgi:hypothetical protein